MAEISRKSNRSIMVAFMKRFAPMYMEAKRIINSKDFGYITSIDSKLCVGPCISEKLFLFDVAIHHVDLIRYLGGEIDDIKVMKHALKNLGIFTYSISYCCIFALSRSITAQRSLVA